MPTVETGPDAYQDLSRIRDRIDYDGSDFFSDNAQLRFDERLVKFERESRKIFETAWGDQTPLEETNREDTIASVPDDAAMPLVYPINDVTEVEYKTSTSGDWRTLDSNWYKWTNHRLILAKRPNTNSMRYHQRGNPLTRDADRTTWDQLASELRVTYDRGFGEEPPADILSVQIQMINNALKSLKQDQTTSAASPDELTDSIESGEMLTEHLRDRISDVTSPGLATMSF